MRSFSRNIAYVALAAFLLNVVLPFFAVYDVSTYQPASSESASVFGEKILICTGDGFKWVTWEELQYGKTKPHPSSRYQCAICYLSAHNLKDFTSPEGEVLYSPKTATAVYFTYNYQNAASVLISIKRSRAPPSFI